MIKSTFVILAIVFLSGFYTNVMAESYGTIDKTTTKLSFSPKDATAGKTIDVAVMITNNSDETIKISKSKHTNSWKDDLAEEKTIEVKSKNSNLLSYRLHVPTEVSPNTYQMIFEIMDSNGNTSIIQGDLVIKGPTPVAIDFTSVLALLVIYYIPAQFIERILELLKLTKPKEPNTFDTIFRSSFNSLLQKISAIEEEILFFEQIRKKIIDKKIKIFESYDPGFNNDDIKKWLTKVEEKLSFITIAETKDTKPKSSSAKPESKPETISFKELYSHHMQNIDAIISSKRANLSKLTNEQATLIWAFSLVMAIVPAALFSVYGIGLLQVLGLSGYDVMYVDVIINILFIGSGTKPIHDIMNRISAKPALASK